MLFVLIHTVNLEHRRMGLMGAEEGPKVGQDTGGQTMLLPKCSMGRSSPRQWVQTGKITPRD